jgi:hypothetical protein
MKRSLVIASLLALSVVALLVACGSSEKGASSTSVSTTETTPAKPVRIALPASSIEFARYSAVPLLAANSPVYPGPATPHSLEGVWVVPTVKKALAQPGVSEALTRNGFVVVPSDLRLFQFAYEDNLYEGWPVFVTTDVAYHEFHLVFDKLLRSLEQKVLLPKLELLVAGLEQAAQQQTAQVAGTPAEDAASRAEQLFQVAQAELGVPVELGPLARREKTLIDAHSASSQTSPILGSKIDYSLFTPRGHYTRTAELKRFFVSMSVLGQLGFCLPGTFDCPPGVEPARIGILASRALTGNPDLVKLWRDIYEPTAFLVGLADDYTPLEVAAAVRKAVPAGTNDPKVFASDSAVTKVVNELTKARPVLINPERAAIRLMGTRFVIDSFLLDQLVYPNVGTPDKPRLFPSALDLAATFGSKFALGVLDQTGETGYANYTSQLEKMQKVVAERPAQAWGSTVYDAWLYALEPVFLGHGQAYPDFMRTDVWAAKDQQSGFGSYAELKHDTILFAKQVVAEGGDGLPVPKRRNWVEPEPVAFARLAAAASLLQSGLDERSLLTKEQAGLLATELDLFRFFERIATDELAGKPISARDNKRLTDFGGELEALWWRTSDLSPYALPTGQDQDAIVADIASSSKGVLELGTGRIDRIYVLVPDDQGNFQVAVGGVYSYYEFKTPPGQRLTDEAWRALIENGKTPERPGWEQAFLAGKAPAEQGSP